MAQHLPAGLWLDGEDAAALDAVLRAAIHDLGRRNGTVPRRLVLLAEEIRRAATEFRTATLANAGTGTGPDARIVPLPPSGTARLSVQSAARYAGTSESYLRRLARRGTVTAVRGQGGGWELDGASLAAWIAERDRARAA